MSAGRPSRFGRRESVGSLGRQDSQDSRGSQSFEVDLDDLQRSGPLDLATIALDETDEAPGARTPLDLSQVSPDIRLFAAVGTQDEGVRIGALLDRQKEAALEAVRMAKRERATFPKETAVPMMRAVLEELRGPDYNGVLVDRWMHRAYACYDAKQGIKTVIVPPTGPHELGSVVRVVEAPVAELAPADHAAEFIFAHALYTMQSIMDYVRLNLEGDSAFRDQTLARLKEHLIAELECLSGALGESPDARHQDRLEEFQHKVALLAYACFPQKKSSTMRKELSEARLFSSLSHPMQNFVTVDETCSTVKASLPYNRPSLDALINHALAIYAQQVFPRFKAPHFDQGVCDPKDFLLQNCRGAVLDIIRLGVGTEYFEIIQARLTEALKTRAQESRELGFGESLMPAWWHRCPPSTFRMFMANAKLLLAPNVQLPGQFAFNRGVAQDPTLRNAYMDYSFFMRTERDFSQTYCLSRSGAPSARKCNPKNAEDVRVVARNLFSFLCESQALARRTVLHSLLTPGLSTASAGAEPDKEIMATLGAGSSLLAAQLGSAAAVSQHLKTQVVGVNAKRIGSKQHDCFGVLSVFEQQVLGEESANQAQPVGPLARVKRDAEIFIANFARGIGTGSPNPFQGLSGVNRQALVDRLRQEHAAAVRELDALKLEYLKQYRDFSGSLDVGKKLELEQLERDIRLYDLMLNYKVLMLSKFYKKVSDEPLIDNAIFQLNGGYKHIQHDQWLSAIEMLMASNLPEGQDILHRLFCKTGKDRTGTVITMVHVLDLHFNHGMHQAIQAVTRPGVPQGAEVQVSPEILANFSYNPTSNLGERGFCLRAMEGAIHHVNQAMHSPMMAGLRGSSRGCLGVVKSIIADGLKTFTAGAAYCTALRGLQLRAYTHLSEQHKSLTERECLLSQADLDAKTNLIFSRLGGDVNLEGLRDLFQRTSQGPDLGEGLVYLNTVRLIMHGSQGPERKTQAIALIGEIKAYIERSGYMYASVYNAPCMKAWEAFMKVELTSANLSKALEDAGKEKHSVLSRVSSMLFGKKGGAAPLGSADATGLTQ